MPLLLSCQLCRNQLTFSFTHHSHVRHIFTNTSLTRQTHIQLLTARASLITEIHTCLTKSHACYIFALPNKFTRKAEIYQWHNHIQTQ